MVASRLFSLVIAAWLVLMSLASAAHASEHDIGGVHSGSYCHLYHHAEQLNHGLAGPVPCITVDASTALTPTFIHSSPSIVTLGNKRIRAPPVSSF